MQHSTDFNALLDARVGLLWQMDLCYVAAACVCAVLAFRTRRRSVASLAAIVGPLIASVLADRLFHYWWLDLEASASTEADQVWISQHDGGRLAVGIALLFKSGLCFLVITIAAWIGQLWRKRRSQKPDADAAPTA